MAAIFVCCHTKSSMMIEMKGLSQAEIPTGCESVSTVMILQYWGIDVTPEQFIDDFLPCEAFYRKDGVLYGPNPEEVFAGNPYERSSLGCYPGVIVQTLERMQHAGYPGMDGLRYKDLPGKGLSGLAARYVSRGIPVLLWVTIGLNAPQDGTQYYLPDGSLYTWRAGEHCLVLCGYDTEYYYLMDPLQDGQRVAYPKALVEERYEQMGKRAAAIWR